MYKLPSWEWGQVCLFVLKKLKTIWCQMEQMQKRKASGQSGLITVGFKTRGRPRPVPPGCPFLTPTFTEHPPCAKKTGPRPGEGYGLGQR